LLYFLICLLYFLSEAVLLAYVTIQLIDWLIVNAE
jgi:hypothetical protein